MKFCVDSTQHALFKLLTIWQNVLNKGGFVASILMDLSKAYDCLKDYLMLAKLQAYDFSKETIKIIFKFSNELNKIELK